MKQFWLFLGLAPYIIFASYYIQINWMGTTDLHIVKVGTFAALIVVILMIAMFGGKKSIS